MHGYLPSDVAWLLPLKSGCPTIGKVHCIIEIHVDIITARHLQLQDALVGATDKKNSSHEKDGEVFYDYEVTGAVSKHVHSSHHVGTSQIEMKHLLMYSLLSSVITCALQDLHYLASITLKSGKVFALFVKSPTKVG